ncbi:2-hydroxyacid dehydrogenase [Yoonia sp. 208BN28-4]|uniref:2-hydroxyacid dehydrogenase n=1 Tax=Yoonia sp. 208BN28-4 TaxID=3126505 RepID=UPI00309F796F
MINVLFSARASQWAEYEPHLRKAFADNDLTVNLATDHQAGDVDYIVFAPSGPVSDFTPYTKTKAVLGLWAGVESIVTNTTLTQPLARMVDEGLTRGMVEWVTGHVLRHHLGMDQHILHQDGAWDDTPPPLAKDRRVTVLGMGALGAACAQTLAGLGFPITGWSRSAKAIDGVTCLHGDDGLKTALQTADIMVLLLPLTDATENVIDADALALMPKGAVIINPGRGPLIDDEALLDALNSGQIGHATLDVFRIEPLPQDHAFWAHPNVTVTPHIASTTRADTASQVIAANIAGVERGAPLQHKVDRDAGY